MSSITQRALDVTPQPLHRVGPLSAYLGAVDSHRDAGVRVLLQPLAAQAAALAEHANVAILAV